MSKLITKYWKVLVLFIAVNSLVSCNISSETTFSPDGSLSENALIDFKDLIQNKKRIGNLFTQTLPDSIIANIPEDSMDIAEEAFAKSFISGFTGVFQDVPLDYTPFTKTSIFERKFSERKGSAPHSFDKIFLKRIETNGETTGLAFQRRNLTKEDISSLENAIGSLNTLNSSNSTDWDGKKLTLKLNLQNNSENKYAELKEMMDDLPISMQYKMNFKRKIKNINADTPTPYLTKVNDYQAVINLSSEQLIELMNGKYTDTFTIETE